MSKQDELGLDDRALTALLLSEREGWRYADELDKERELQDDLIARQGALLRGVVNAIKGPPPDDTLWSHHDAPELAAGVMAELEALRAAIRSALEYRLPKHAAEELRAALEARKGAA